MSSLELVAVLVAAVLGGVAQTSLGFGGSFVLVPVVTLVLPEALPSAVLVGLLPLITRVAWRDRAALDRATFRMVSVARVPGILVGTWLVTAVSTRGLTLVVAVSLLAAVAAAAVGREVPRTSTSLRLAGLVSGVTGTAVALGGPPLALVFHREAGADRRATLSAIFTVGLVLSLVMLGIVGEFGRDDVAMGALLGAALMVGNVAAAPILRRADDDRLRIAVLVWAAVGAVAAGLRALL